MVAGEDHIRHLGSDSVRPLLPEIPVGFVQDVHITAEWASLVRDLSSGERDIVGGVIDHATRELRGGPVVADRLVIGAGQDTRVPVVRVTDVTTMPGESDSLLDSAHQLFVGTSGVGVPQVIQHGDGELG